MAIDFPVPSQVGETFTDPSSGKVFQCTVVGPPAVWASGAEAPTPTEFVTLDTQQTISGVKTFTGDPLQVDSNISTDGNVTTGGNVVLNDLLLYAAGGVQPTQQAITANSFDLQDAYVWTLGAITVPNPTNAVAGMNGLITVTAAPTAWGSNFVFTDGGTPPALSSFPTILPYSVQSATSILIGNAIGF